MKYSTNNYGINGKVDCSMVQFPLLDVLCYSKYRARNRLFSTEVALVHFLLQVLHFFLPAPFAPLSMIRAPQHREYSPFISSSFASCITLGRIWKHFESQCSLCRVLPMLGALYHVECKAGNKNKPKKSPQIFP